MAKRHGAELKPGASQAQAKFQQGLALHQEGQLAQAQKYW